MGAGMWNRTIEHVELLQLLLAKQCVVVLYRQRFHTSVSVSRFAVVTRTNCVISVDY